MTTPPFETTVSRPRGQAIVIAVHEPILDYSNMDTLGEVVAEAFEPEIRCVVIDMGDVEFCDSTTLSAFIRADNRIRSAGGRLSLVGLGPQPQRLMELTNIDHLIPLFATAPEALDNMECDPE